MSNRTRTVVITGADSGIGFEAAVQFANTGFGRVVVTARTDAKAEQAVTALVARSGTTVFTPLTLDLDDRASIDAAADTLVESGTTDVLVLNAGGLPRRKLVRSSAGIERHAAALTGHHRFTMRLLETGGLSPSARIMIAGSESLRGDLPIVKPLDVDRLAKKYYDGNLERLIEAIMRVESPIRYNAIAQFATTKLFAAWWAAALSRRLPAGMTVNAIAPGSTPETNGFDDTPMLSRRIATSVMWLIPRSTQPVAAAAGRYLVAANFGSEINGAFFASRPRRSAGPMVHNELVDATNPRVLRCLWNATERLAGRHDVALPNPAPAHAPEGTHIPRPVRPTGPIITAACSQ
ncbi:SDR family NAD(P)-dependent oxidoreductase [Ilumatobacter coccineus]|uniref:Putative oxidoreductase n=1 Tax=Ilumatobacter coccineus (strain NBRC 103263 / KCTC 29153 / YM16-304) TaxID=1313172 RepID=A0A6C7EC77_ILUCY|nr:SDR family NAD(P)-dependent oxidoreductase [Ilumatobacter coccineus]BAN04367.1 putative oxidoreductase [Ilumatobacter coccineus YM16-304]